MEFCVDTGSILAGGLFGWGGGPKATDELREMVRKADLLPQIYWREMLCLSGAAIDWAIQVHVTHDQKQQLVRTGFFDRWLKEATHLGASSIRTLETLKSRLHEYAGAAKLELHLRPEPIASPLANLIETYLVKAGANNANPEVRRLAEASIIHFYRYYEATSQVLTSIPIAFRTPQ